jgi:molecular chaperone GrpE
MASDPTAGGAPAEMPAETPDSSLDIPPKPEGAAELQLLVEQLQAEKADLQDKQLRALAEAQNTRRRAQQDVEKERKFGIERFARDVLSVADNLGRALSALPADLETLDPALRNVIVGVQATDRELQSVLERHGVTRVEALGKPFNAEFHQAMMEVEDPSVPAGTVVQELIPGYLIAGRLLRPAMVAVSKGGPVVRPPSNEN